MSKAASSWHAKTAKFLWDEIDLSPAELLYALRRHYGLDIYAAVNACYTGIPWGPLVLPQNFLGYWENSSPTHANGGLGELIEAICQADPELPAELIVAGFSICNKVDFEELITTMYWCGQFSRSELLTSLKLLHESWDKSTFLIVPPPRAWMKSIRKAEEFLDSIGIIELDEANTKPRKSRSIAASNSNDTEKKLLTASDFLEMTIGQHREVRDALIAGTRPANLAEALGTAQDCAVQFENVLSEIELSSSFFVPTKNLLPLPAGATRQFKNSNFPQPPKDEQNPPVAYGLNFWYLKASDAWKYVALLASDVGNFDLAIRASEKALLFAAKSCNRHKRGQAYNNLAHILMLESSQLSLERAKPALLQALKHYELAGAPSKVGLVHANLTRLRDIKKGLPDKFKLGGHLTIDVPAFHNGVFSTEKEDK